jgi:hypothetical protein
VAHKKEEIVRVSVAREQIDVYRDYLSGLNITHYFKAGLADQTVLFDLQNDSDLMALGYHMSKLPELIL